MRKPIGLSAPILTIAILLSMTLSPAMGQLRIVNYNTTGGPRTGMDEIVRAIGDENVNGIAKAPDVFTLQEQSSSATTTQSIVNILNSIYGAGTYARATLDGGTTGGGRPGLIYNTNTVQLIDQTTASTTSSTGAARQAMRYQLRPIGYNAAADFYVYSAHFKASDSSSDQSRRNVEAQQIRANADLLGQGAHLMYAGDFNIQSSGESMYQTMLAAGNGQAFDPINRPGVWKDGASFKDIHTQNPAGSGFVGGGMDDRFDFQLLSGEMLDNEGLSYIGNSYRAFGNTNSHSMNGAINTAGAAAMQARLPGYTTPQAQAVLDALAIESDHLPLVSDYQLPAKMGVTIGAAPSSIIVGAAVNVQATVTNNANVSVALGADELDYQIQGTGDVGGSASGTDAATGGGNAHLLPLNSTVAGSRTGTITASSSSQAAANATFGQNIAYNVFDHSNASFAGDEDANSIEIDFGTILQGSGQLSTAFSINNLISTLGYTAALDLDDIVASGDHDVLSTDLAAFDLLAAGSSIPFSAYFDTSSPGSYMGVFTIHLSDEDLPGELQNQVLNLTMRGTVIAVPEPMIGSVLLALAAFARPPRRRHQSPMLPSL